MAKDRIGLKYGRLTVIGFLGIHFRYGRNRRIYNCKCDCGVNIEMTGDALGKTKSCGCLKVDSAKNNILHGECRKDSRTKEYSIFQTMKSRCYNPNTEKYPQYGGRGIKICERWLNDFQFFIDDMGRCPDKNYSIDRIDVNGDYTPDNCRWATNEQQCNNKTNSVFLMHNGEKLTITQWHRKSGYEISLRTFRRKLNEQGYSLSDLIRNNRQ